MTDFHIVDETSIGGVSCRQYGNGNESFIVIETKDIVHTYADPSFVNNYWVYARILPESGNYAELFLNEFLEGYKSQNGIIKQSKPYFIKYSSYIGTKFEWVSWDGIVGLEENMFETAKYYSTHFKDLESTPFMRIIKQAGRIILNRVRY